MVDFINKNTWEKSEMKMNEQSILILSYFIKLNKVI